MTSLPDNQPGPYDYQDLKSPPLPEELEDIVRNHCMKTRYMLINKLVHEIFTYSCRGNNQLVLRICTVMMEILKEYNIDYISFQFNALHVLLNRIKCISDIESLLIHHFFAFIVIVNSR